VLAQVPAKQASYLTFCIFRTDITLYFSEKSRSLQRKLSIERKFLGRERNQTQAQLSNERQNGRNARVIA
jgi:hypothetical protein